jgi:hypothetical protein
MMSPRKVLVSVAALIGLLASAHAALAQECVTAADCGKGFTCELTMATPVAVKGVACAAGSVCPVADPATPPTDAGTATTGFCVEASCATDADCGATMVCHTESYQECTGGTSACPANSMCFAPTTPPSCTTKSVSTCMYKWQLPCKADAECGDGFSCVFSTIGACSGSGGTGMGVATSGTTGTGTRTPVVDGGAAPPPTADPAPSPPSTNCMTTTSTIGSCQPKATTCTVDGDCPAAWKCVDALPVRGGPLPAQPADAGTATAVGAPAPATGAPSGTGTPAPGPAPAPSKVCQSPLGTFGGGGVALDATGAPQPNGTQGTGGSGGTPKIGAPNGSNPMAPGNQSATGASSSGGCNVGGAAGRSSLALSALALLGLVLARRRR